MPPYFSTIPVKDKRPLVKWEEYTKRLPTPEEKALWKKQFPGSDTGIVTGPISKIFVLDIDGEEGLKALDERGYKLPMTWVIKTRRGWHYYFKWVEALDNKVTTQAGLLESVDTRGTGGYVVFYNLERRYQPTVIANPPKWLIDLLPNKNGQIETQPIKSDSWIETAFTGMKEGNRNATFTRVAGKLRNDGYSASDLFALLRSKAREVGIGERELEGICRSVERYEPRPKCDVLANPSTIEEFLSDISEVKWICEPIVAFGALGFVAGLPETGKTWALIDLAVEAARKDKPGLWLGRFPIANCKVLFVDQERPKIETQRRFRAVIAAKNIDTKELGESLFIRCGTTTRIDLEHSYQAFRKELAEVRPDIVIVDSFATFHTKEESNRMEVQQVLERIKALRDEFKCAFVFVHHETKASYQARKEGQEPNYLDMAGNVAIPAAAEFTMNVVKNDENTSMVFHTKSTMGSKLGSFMIKVEDVTPDKKQIKVEAF